MGRADPYDPLAGGPGDSAPLLPPTEPVAGVYYQGPRQRRDVGWLVAYVVWMLLALAGGIYAIVER